MSIASASLPTSNQANGKKVTEVFQEPSFIYTNSITVKVEDYLAFQGLSTAIGDVFTSKHGLDDSDGDRIMSFQVGIGMDDSQEGYISFNVDPDDIDKRDREEFLHDAVVTHKIRFNCPRRRALFFPPLGYLATGSAHLRTHEWEVKAEVKVPSELLSGALEIQVDVSLFVFNQFKFTKQIERHTLSGDEKEDVYEPIVREENDHLADVEVLSPSKRFKCHKFHLSRRSKVFEAMFKHPLEESRTNEVSIADFEDETVADMIRFIYEGNLDDEKFDERLLAIAEKYEIDNLKQCCEVALAERLDYSVIAQMWVNADQCQAKLLKEAVIKYLCDNWERREEFENFERVLIERPTLIKDILPLISIK